jgi:hypothetical protein
VSVATAILVTVGAAALAMGAMVIARRLAPPGGFLGTPEPNHTGSALAALGTGFAILTAFVLLLAFQSYGNAKRSADDEAGAVQEQYYVAGLFPAAPGRMLQGELICYGRAVVNDEWPRMRHRQRSPVVDEWTVALARDIRPVLSRGLEQSSQMSEWFDQRAVREDGRRERLQEAAPFVPPLLWVALLLGAAVLGVYLLTFANPAIRLPFQLTVIGALAVITAMNLSVIRFLDRPYENVAGSIKPSAMRQALSVIERAPAAPAPCDRRGRPA